LLRFGPHDEFPSPENWPMSNAGVTLLHDPQDGECRYCAKLVGEANQDEACGGAAPLRKALQAIAHDSACHDTRAVARYALGMGEPTRCEFCGSKQHSLAMCLAPGALDYRTNPGGFAPAPAVPAPRGPSDGAGAAGTPPETTAPAGLPTPELRCPAKDCLCDGLFELPISTEPEGIRRDRLCLYCRRQYRSHKSGLVEIAARLAVEAQAYEGAHFADCPIVRGASVDCSPPGECERRRAVEAQQDRERLREAELALANARRLVKHALRMPVVVAGYITTFRELDALLDAARSERPTGEKK
jgi:hypothetical protein